MKNSIYKQRVFEAGTIDLSVAITKVRNHDGIYVYMVDTSEAVYAKLELNLPVFETWLKAWQYIKENYPEWYSFRPYFIHKQVSNTVLKDLKKAIGDLTFQERINHKGGVEKHWRSTLGVKNIMGKQR